MAEPSNISTQCDDGSSGQSEQISIAKAQVKAATLLISRATTMAMQRWNLFLNGKLFIALLLKKNLS
jgi:hypothetical protein